MLNRSALRARALPLVLLLLSTAWLADASLRAQAVATAPAAAGQRRIVVQGAPNLRDLGGYATTDGRHVRWKKIYRSGELSRLTADDYKIINGLGIAVVCDFRREGERNAAPTKWQGERPPTILNLSGSQAERTGGGRGRGSATSTQPAAPAQPGLSTLLVNSYPTYPTTLASSYRTTIEQLMTTNGAVLYHCTAGKDRTGTFSAMLLTMLGVPRETVMEDYLLTNEFLATPERVDAVIARGGSREAALTSLGVDRTYLDLMFKAIDTEYGSFDEYRRKALGVSDADLEVLKRRLLE